MSPLTARGEVIRQWHSRWFMEFYWGSWIALGVPLVFAIGGMFLPQTWFLLWILRLFGGIGGILYALALPNRRLPKFLWLILPGFFFILTICFRLDVSWMRVLLEGLWSILFAHIAWLALSLHQRHRIDRIA